MQQQAQNGEYNPVFTNCQRCRRALRNQQAMEIGYGKVCLSKVGGKFAIGSAAPRNAEERAGMMNSGEPIRAGVFARIEGAGGIRVTNIPWRIIIHSPDGFAWGYAGSGPDDFAINIAEEVLLKLGYKGPRKKVKAGPDGNGRMFRLSNDLGFFIKSYVAELDQDKGGVIPWGELRKVAYEFIGREAIVNE